MKKTNEINDFKQRLSNLENLRKESRAGEKSGRTAKVLIVLKWYNKVRKEGVEVEVPEGTVNILLDRSIELVRALEEEDKKK